jgi:hypothetical protein
MLETKLEKHALTEIANHHPMNLASEIFHVETLADTRHQKFDKTLDFLLNKLKLYFITIEITSL